MPPRTGEEVEAVHQRAADFLQLFIITLEQRWPGIHKQVVLMSHAATVIALARALTSDRNLSLRVGCCSVTELVRPADAKRILGGWEARRLNDGTFLKDGTGRDWGFEDIEIADGKVSTLISIPLKT
jgi:transcription factor C subunit 7